MVEDRRCAQPGYGRGGMTIIRGALAAALALAFHLAPLAADAQPAGKVYRIGFLWSGSPTPATDLIVEAFRQGLRELGVG